VKTHGDTPISAWKRGDIAAGRDKRSSTPSAARHFVDTLRGLFIWLVESDLVAADPTAGIEVARPKTEGFPPWTPGDEAAFRARWPLGTRERVAFEVLRQTGLRRGDAVRVGRPHLGVLNAIRIDTEKTGERVTIRVSAEAATARPPTPLGTARRREAADLPCRVQWRACRQRQDCNGERLSDGRHRGRRDRLQG
jgi:hypothetical protein